MRRTNEELCMAPTKSNWSDGRRIQALQNDYHNQRRYSKRARFEWWAHSEHEERVFRDT